MSIEKTNYLIGNENYECLREHQSYKYAKDVVEGRILTNIWIKKECKRFLEMIDNTKSKFYKKYFVDIYTVKTISGIVKLTNFATGEYAGTSCYDKIAGFQWYILINIYATKHRDRPKKRRYEKACCFVSRKNARVLAL